MLPQLSDDASWPDPFQDLYATVDGKSVMHSDPLSLPVNFDKDPVAVNIFEPPVPAPAALQASSVVALVSPPCAQPGAIIKRPLGNSVSDLNKKKRKGVIKRSDAPCLDPSRRGSMALALSAGRPENRLSTLQQARAREFANSGLAPRRSRWRAWVRLHRNWWRRTGLTITQRCP